jgi:large repetitive protein
MAVVTLTSEAMYSAGALNYSNHFSNGGGTLYYLGTNVSYGGFDFVDPRTFINWDQAWGATYNDFYDGHSLSNASGDDVTISRANSAAFSAYSVSLDSQNSIAQSLIAYGYKLDGTIVSVTLSLDQVQGSQSFVLGSSFSGITKLVLHPSTAWNFQLTGFSYVSLSAPASLADAAIVETYVNKASDTGSQVLTGTADAGSTIKVYDGGAALAGAVTADSSGNWSYTLGVLADGSHSLTATATDAAGNTSAASAALVFTVDTVAPNAPSMADAAIANGYVNKAAAAGQALTGTAEAGSTVAVYDGDLVIGSASADANGNWSYALALPDGAHSLTATATDVAGNTSAASAALAFTQDTVAPNAPSMADAAIANGYVNKAAAAGQALTGTAEAGSTVAVYDGDLVIGSASADANGNWSYALALPDGAHSLTATVTDLAGNTSAASAALVFTVDTVAPDAPSMADAAIANGYVNKAAAAGQALTGTAEAGSTVAVYDGDLVIGSASADANGNWSYALALPDGAHSLTATATDAAGNTSAASAALAFTQDTVAPNAPSMADAAIANGYVDKANDTASQVLTGTAEAGSSVTVYDAGAALGATTAGADGKWSCTLGALADGSHTLTATATDAAGNVSAASAALSFTVDTQAPDAPGSLLDAAIAGGYVNAANDTASQVLTGTAEAGSTVTVYDAGAALGATTAGADGKWSYTLGELADGSHSLAATATDTAGNVSAASAALSFAVDTQAPVTCILDVFQPKGGPTTPLTVRGISEANGTITVFDGDHTVIGTTRADASGQWTLSTAQLTSVVHTLRSTGVDLAGNEGDAANVAIFGTAGKDALVSTGGATVLQGAGGNNDMTASTGADTFVFHAAFGHNTINSFDVNHDVLAFDRGMLPATVKTDADLMAYVLGQSTDHNGSAMLTAADQGIIVLVGVPIADLNVSDFHLLG